MTIAQVKAEIASKSKTVVATLNMVRQLDKENKPSEWLQHWDNDTRIRIVMHQDVFEQIKANRDFEGLAVKPAIQVDAHTDEKGKEVAAYTKYFVITPKNIEATF